MGDRPRQPIRDKPEEEQARVLAGLEGDGPYANRLLATEMRRAR